MSCRPLIIDYTTKFGGAFEQGFSLAGALSDIDGVTPGLATAQRREALAKKEPVSFPTYTFSPVELRAGDTNRFAQARDVVFAEVPTVFRVAACGKAHAANLFHLNNVLNSQLSGVFAAKLRGAKCVSCHQDFEYPSRMTKAVARLVDHHVAISEVIKQDLLDFGIPESRITIIHNCVDTTRFSPAVTPVDLQARFGIPQGRLVVALFGRLVSWKGQDVFLKAMADVLPAVPEAHGLIVGDGEPDHVRGLEQLAHDLQIADRVTFGGYHADTPQLLRSVDVVTHMSTRPEPFGLVVSEAMAAGKPIVAMAEGGPLEIVLDGETGLLVPPREPKPTADAIIRLLRDERLRTSFGAKARERVIDRFSAEHCAKQYAALYNRLLSNGG